MEKEKNKLPLYSIPEMHGIVNDEKLLTLFCSQMAAISQSKEPYREAVLFYRFIKDGIIETPHRYSNS